MAQHVVPRHPALTMVHAMTMTHVPKSGSQVMTNMHTAVAQVHFMTQTPIQADVFLVVSDG